MEDKTNVLESVKAYTVEELYNPEITNNEQVILVDDINKVMENIQEYINNVMTPKKASQYVLIKYMKDDKNEFKILPLEQLDAFPDKEFQSLCKTSDTELLITLKHYFTILDKARYIKDNDLSNDSIIDVILKE